MKNRYKVAGAFAIAVALMGNGLARADSEKLHAWIGEVSVVDASANTVAIKGTFEKKEKEPVFHLIPETRILQNGQKLTAADLKAGERVVVHYSSTKGMLTAHSIFLEGQMTRPAAEKKP